MNRQYFSKEQIVAGELNEFLEVLLKQCYGKSENYNDIQEGDIIEAFIMKEIKR